MKTDTLDKIFDIDTIDTQAVNAETLPAITPASLPVVPTVTSNDTPLAPINTQEIEDDVQYARTGIRDMIDKTRIALDAAIILAQSGDSPRAYEVVGKLLDNIVSANRELVDLHRAKRDVVEKPTTAGSLLPQDTSNPAVNVEKAVFVGRMSDLLREIRSAQKRETESSTE